MITCEVEGCDRAETRMGMCGMHYKRWYRHGDTSTVLRGVKPSKGQWINKKSGYVQIKVGGKLTTQHQYLAEKALGRPLPHGAEVHHLDENPANNDPSNLVICPNHEYHVLLHQRGKAYAYRTNR